MDLVGLYLYGSRVSGGFDDGISDLDFVAVVARDVEVLELASLERMHGEFVAGHPAWNDRIDVVYIGRDTLARFRTNEGKLAVISPGESFHVTGDPRDWLMNWFHVRRDGVTLYGPRPEELVPPIEWHEFTEGVTRYVDWFRSDIARERGSGYLAYAVLSACRALYAVRVGRPASKQEAAEWTKEHMPDVAWLIDAALAARQSRGADFDDPRTRNAAEAFLDRVSVELRTPAGGTH